MAQQPAEAYTQGYTDGLRMAEKMRWQGTPIGNVLKGSPYRPDRDYRVAYDQGFRQAMEDASRPEWIPPGEEESE